MSTEVIVSEGYTKAVSLTRSIIANAQAAQASLYEVCKGLKEMRDRKLYKELGYQNFEEYCENEVGITIQQGRKYTAIASMMESEKGNLSFPFEQIGVTKLYLLSQLDSDDRTELQQNVDVETVTVKELKAEIADLQSKNADAAEQLSKKDKQFKAAMESKQNELDDFREGAKRRQDNLMKKISMLNEKIKELEERPVEHDIVDNTEEIESLKQQLAEAKRQLSEKPMVQDVLPVMPMQVIDSRGEFMAHLGAASDSLDRLHRFMEQHAHDANMPYFMAETMEIIGAIATRITDLKGDKP